MPKNDLAVITVVYQNYKVLKDFFTSLKKQTNKNFKLFISDLSETKKQIKADGVEFLVISGQNKGYAHGVNVGLKKAIELGFTNFLIINNDTYFQEDFVEKVITSLKNNPGSIVGGKIYYAQGYEYHKDRYNQKDLGKVLWFAGGYVDWQNVITPHIGVDEVDNGKYDNKVQTDFLTATLMVFDKNVLSKVGFWEESYFLYYEDADYSERAKRKGVGLIYDPQIVIWHKVSQSTGGSGSKMHQKYQGKNRIKFGLKYAPYKTKFHLIKNALASYLGWE